MHTDDARQRVIALALQQLGKPYILGSAGPDTFDCSGLVYYSYMAAGLNVPRSTKGLWRSARPVSLKDVRKGDLVFFDQRGKKYSHVGIYAGDNLFVHSPRTGKKVRTSSLLDPYWQKNLIEARRF